jgi:hypothetical protein
VTKEQFWREQIAGQPGSGLSIRGYCRRRRLRESAFYFWRKELARRGVSTARQAAFVPVRITGEASSADSDGRQAEGGSRGRIEIVLGNGPRIRLLGPVDRQSLGDVLAVLEGRSC